MKTIETTDLKNVTGGCAACGGNCANGPAPQQPQGKTAGASWATSPWAKSRR